MLIDAVTVLLEYLRILCIGRSIRVYPSKFKQYIDSSSRVYQSFQIFRRGYLLYNFSFNIVIV